MANERERVIEAAKKFVASKADGLPDEMDLYAEIAADFALSRGAWVDASERLPEFGRLVNYVRDHGDELSYHAVVWTELEQSYSGPQWNNVVAWRYLEPFVRDDKEGE